MRKNRIIINVILVVMMSLFICGCGKKVENENTNDIVENMEENIEEDNLEPSFTNFSDVDQHKSTVVSELEQVFTQNDIPYAITSNGDVLLGSESSYTLLDDEYDITEVAYSLYNPELNTIDTVFSFKYEVHEEKGMEIDSKHSKWLYEMLKYFGCNEFSSVENMVTQLNESDDVLVETESVYIEARKYVCYASAIIREECDFTSSEYKYMDFASLDERENYMGTLESEIEAKFAEYKSKGGNIVDADGNPLVRFRCMDANDEANMDNDLGIMVSLLEISGQQEYKKDGLELLKIICDYIGIENMTNMNVTSQEIAEQLMTYVEMEVYFADKDEPFFSWQQEGGWDRLFSPVEYFDSNVFGIQYENARYYEWNRGDNVYKGIYIPATVQGLKNR